MSWIDVQRGYLRYAPAAWPGKERLARPVNEALRERPHRGVTRTSWGDWVAVDTTDLIQRFLYMWGTWEPHMSGWLRRTLRPGDGYVDVGANIGVFSLLAAKLVGSTGHVVAIEAFPSVHERLVRHAKFNGRTNIKALNAAVSSRTETLEFILASQRNLGAGGIVPYDGEAEARVMVKARPLPDLLEEQEIRRARVIKIDVEGAEGGVIRGLAPVLDRLRPDAEITVEVSPARMEQVGETVDDLLHTMTSRGFHMYRIPNSYDPARYPSAIAHPEPPHRWREPTVTEECDLVFSRRDVDAL